MSRFISIFLLLLHINTTMFMPVIDDANLIDSRGKAIDDINTIIEYVDQVLLQHEDTTPGDDDSHAQYAHLVKIPTYISDNVFKIVVQYSEPVIHKTKIKYPILNENLLPEVVSDILVPPPDFSA